MWLCSTCMKLHAWSRPCSSHNGDMILAPFNGYNAYFLIHMNLPTVPVENPDNNVVVEYVSCLNLQLLNSVFQKQIPTAKTIPPKCRLQFLRVLKSTLDKVISYTGDTSTWIQLILFPICILRVYSPKCSFEEKSSIRNKLQAASINQAIMRWREPNGCSFLVHKILEELNHPRNKKKGNKKISQNAINLRICLKNIRIGLFTAAIKVLSSNGIAPNDEATLNELLSKHPQAHPPHIPPHQAHLDNISTNSEVILNRLKSFPKGTACGRDGLRVQHLLDALSGPAAAITDELLSSITRIINLWLSGRCPPQLGEFVASAPLTPLLKPDGNIRPIAVGTIWRRIVSKFAAHTVCKEMSSFLGDYQFGVFYAAAS
ncbi:uncharacterized protein LOC113318286 [Papaver somniferum]|uniref:uncharacterized protein LOC113318286 n=1 Tax=Papaver somniferum TaxID=3469 RepID=UPI000E6FACC6|nr:uncharacterized protein LOC113318286 [Papaver somniferum]